eukprot:gene13509-17930_t
MWLWGDLTSALLSPRGMLRAPTPPRVVRAAPRASPRNHSQHPGKAVVLGDGVLASAYFRWGALYTILAEATLHGNFSALGSSIFEGFDVDVPALSQLSQKVSQATRTLVAARERELRGGRDAIFCGPLRDNTGATRAAATS